MEQAYIIEIIHLLWIPECHLEHKSQSIIFNVGIIMEISGNKLLNNEPHMKIYEITITKVRCNLLA